VAEARAEGPAGLDGHNDVTTQLRARRQNLLADTTDTANLANDRQAMHTHLGARWVLVDLSHVSEATMLDALTWRPSRAWRTCRPIRRCLSNSPPRLLSA
jgi:hypothetical protein